MKPFDVKDLGERLKKRGLDVAEEGAQIVAEETLNWAKDGVLATEGKLDDLAAPLIDALKPAIQKAIDKIDGQEG